MGTDEGGRTGGVRDGDECVGRGRMRRARTNAQGEDERAGRGQGEDERAGPGRGGDLDLGLRGSPAEPPEPRLPRRRPVLRAKADADGDGAPGAAGGSSLGSTAPDGGRERGKTAFSDADAVRASKGAERRFGQRGSVRGGEIGTRRMSSDSAGSMHGVAMWQDGRSSGRPTESTIVDCRVSRRSTVMSALRRNTGVIHAYQSDCASQRSDSSVLSGLPPEPKKPP